MEQGRGTLQFGKKQSQKVNEIIKKWNSVSLLAEICCLLLKNQMLWKSRRFLLLDWELKNPRASLFSNAVSVSRLLHLSSVTQLDCIIPWCATVAHQKAHKAIRLETRGKVEFWNNFPFGKLKASTLVSFKRCSDTLVFVNVSLQHFHFNGFSECFPGLSKCFQIQMLMFHESTVHQPEMLSGAQKD